MKKRYVALGLLVIIITAVFAVRAINARLEYVRELETFRARDFETWVADQRGVASRLDQALAEALVSPPDRLQKALDEALQQAYRGQEVFWRVGIPHAVYSAADSWGYRHYYQEMAAYLQHLIAKDEAVPLTAFERDSLTLMRQFTDLFHAGFSSLLPHVRYQVTNRRGQSTIRYQPWHAILDNQDMINLIVSLGHDANLLPKIGDSDQVYAAARAQRHQQLSRYDHYGLLYSGEAEYSESEMFARAIEFMETFASGDVVDPWTSERVINTEKTQTVTSSYGNGSSMGGYQGFRLGDSETKWNYDIGVTTVGGHISHIGIQEKSSQIGPREDLLQFTEQLLSKWAEFEGVGLKRVRFSDEESTIQMAYAPVIDGIAHVDKHVGVVIYPDNSHHAVRIEAGRYFMRYNAPVPGEPAITPQEALSVLTPNVIVKGEPRLELHYETLLYAIPVEGVERVSVIYVNALSGEFVRMEYDYSRP